MSFVFVSHASKDKRRLKPVVDALLQAGLKVFLDNPAAAGYTKDQLHQFYRLRAGAQWAKQIDDAQRQAACTLICWSGYALDLEKRSVWLEEIVFAQKTETAVACKIDAVDPTRLRQSSAAHQIHNVDPDLPQEMWAAGVQALIDDIERKIDDRNRMSLNVDRWRSAGKLPLLADRDAQEPLFNNAIIRAAVEGGVHPIALKSPLNELPQQFLERVKALSGSQSGGGDPWYDLTVPWPKEAGPISAFQDKYRAKLVTALQIRSLTDREIAASLAKRPLYALVHSLHAEHWRRDEIQRIGQWLDYWRKLATLEPDLHVVPVLRINLPEVKPGWKECPRGPSGGRLQIQAIWKAVRKLGAQSRKAYGISFEVPPVLAPIGKTEADEWFEQDLATLDPASLTAVRAELDALYARRHARRHGIPHAEFFNRLSPICGGLLQEK